jgi:ribosomal-protein-alanine N-acetyltransferase
MNANKFPIIDLGDIILREIVDEDASDYLAYMSRDEMRGFLTESNMVLTIERALEEVSYWGSLFRRGYSIYWAIALKENGKMIGTAGFNSVVAAHKRAELSYDLSYDYWGKGIMLQSVKAILQYAFTRLSLVRVQSTVITDNQRSINVLERCGFAREGYMQKYEIVEGEHKDYYLYAKVM